MLQVIRKLQDGPPAGPPVGQQHSRFPQARPGMSVVRSQAPLRQAKVHGFGPPGPALQHLPPQTVPSG